MSRFNIPPTSGRSILPPSRAGIPRSVRSDEGSPHIRPVVPHDGPVEHREGWEPFDPDRPCYTCGCSVSHWIAEGEPAYSCGPHPPITVDHPLSRWSARAWDEEREIAERHMRRVRDHAAALGAETKYEIPGKGNAVVLVQGFLAEIVLARMSGEEWHPTLYEPGKPKPPDVGSWEVRSTTVPGNPLDLYENDPRDRPVVLVDVRGPFHVARGWVIPRDFVGIPSLFDPVKRTGRKMVRRWRVPRSSLRPMDGIPRG